MKNPIVHIMEQGKESRYKQELPIKISRNDYEVSDISIDFKCKIPGCTINSHTSLDLDWVNYFIVVPVPFKVEFTQKFFGSECEYSFEITPLMEAD